MNKGQVKGLISPLLERIRLRNIARYVKGRKVLDVGCGRCALRKYLGDIEYCGLEKDKSIDVPDGVKIFYKDVEGDLDGIGKYDTIVLCEVIEHIENPRRALINLKQHLNNEGIILISTSIPFRYKIHAYTSKIGITDKEAEHEHKTMLTMEGIYRLANEAGLKVRKYVKTEFWSKQTAILEM